MQNKALEAFSSISKEYLFNSNNIDSLKSMDSEFLKHYNFLYFKIVDNKKVLFEKETDEYQNVILSIKKYDHDIKIHDDTHATIHLIHDYEHDRYYLKIKMPFLEKNMQGDILGLYDANNIVDDIYKKLFYDTLELAIMFILIFSGVYPTILLLQKGFMDKTKKLAKSNIDILKTLGSAIAKRDSDTNLHNYRVTLYSIVLAEAINLPKKDFTSLIKGAFLHDIGKIGISDNILLKPAKLTNEEFETMKTHTRIGKEIVNNNSFLQDAIDIIQYHHEKFDGSGYPTGLKEEEIPLNARIFSIVDVFDALTSKRPYKEPFSFEKAKEIMISDSGTHFDPKLITVFFDSINEYYENLKNLDEDFLIHLLDLKISIYCNNGVLNENI